MKGAQIIKESKQIDKILLDTDVLNFISKRNHRLAPKFRPIVQNKILATTFISVAEIYFGIFKNVNYQKRWWNFWVKNVFPNLVIIYPDYKTCEIFGRLRADDKKYKPHRNTNFPDLWIASCAIQFDLPLLTNNIKHFQHINNLKLIQIHMS